MALTSQQQNHISRTMQYAEQLIALQDDIRRHRAEWDQNDMFNQMTDQDIADIPSFAHLNKSKLGNAMDALDDVPAGLGDYTAGKLLDLVKVRP